VEGPAVSLHQHPMQRFRTGATVEALYQGTTTLVVP
jgi:hypothetical protein